MAFNRFRFTAWSFSRWSDYQLCPLKAKLKHLDKIQEPKNDAMQRGADLHDLARDYLVGTIKKVPAPLTLAKVELNRIRTLVKKRVLGAIVEEQWAFTADWTVTVWNDWAHCVVRVKVDAAEYLDAVTLMITDWKSGKLRLELHEEYLVQLELYALAAFMKLPHLEKVIPRLFYTDLGQVYPPIGKEIVYTRADVPKLKARWAKRTKPLLSDTVFAPRPNDKCRWCWYGQAGKAKGGPNRCKF